MCRVCMSHMFASALFLLLRPCQAAAQYTTTAELYEVPAVDLTDTFKSMKHANITKFSGMLVAALLNISEKKLLFRTVLSILKQAREPGPDHKRAAEADFLPAIWAKAADAKEFRRS